MSKALISAGVKEVEDFESYRRRMFGFTFTRKQDRECFHMWLKHFKIKSIKTIK